MHIPDGLIAAPVYATAAAIAVPAWAWGVRRVARTLDEATVPRMAVVTALAFVLSSIMLPLPGGAAAHLSGVGLLVVLFGFWPAFLALNGVLALQVLLLGMGGVTTLPITALALGGVGGGVTLGLRSLSKGRHGLISVVLPVAAGIVAAAFVLALVLGAQPRFGTDATGQPLYFPFGPTVTIPALVLPHLVLGLAEGMLTWSALSVLAKRTPAT
ncbi:MAG: energy-coupling factor ABC transporter permease [Candidatus Wenzhouxiangella sp. M2_3B_020]